MEPKDINIIKEVPDGPYDHHCPQMGSGLNTWFSLCEQRQGFESLREICGAGDGCKAYELEAKARAQQKISSSGVNYQKETIELSNDGMSTQQIADKLGISKSTVKKYRRKEREKNEQS